MSSIRSLGEMATRTPMLPRVQPIAPVTTKEPFDDPRWLFDVKYDGFRALCYHEQGHCRLISRNGNLMRRFAGLGEKIATSLDVDEAILDGEIVAADETGRPQFYDLSPKCPAARVRGLRFDLAQRRRSAAAAAH